MVVYNIGGPGIVFRDSTKKVDVINCDSYDNYDLVTLGENANGFTIVGVGPETNIHFTGCRAWNNSDDGFDNFGSDGKVAYESCWSFYNGTGSSGNGFGFKLGPDGNNTNNIHVSNCIAAENRSVGFGRRKLK
jgi:hypothetical protein